MSLYDYSKKEQLELQLQSWERELAQDGISPGYESVCRTRIHELKIELAEFPGHARIATGCHCGSSVVGSPRHSSWCPKYKQ